MTFANLRNIHLAHTEMSDAYRQTEECTNTQPNVYRCLTNGEDDGSENTIQTH